MLGWYGGSDDRRVDSYLSSCILHFFLSLRVYLVGPSVIFWLKLCLCGLGLGLLSLVLGGFTEKLDMFESATKNLDFAAKLAVRVLSIYPSPRAKARLLEVGFSSIKVSLLRWMLESVGLNTANTTDLERRRITVPITTAV